MHNVNAKTKHTFFVTAILTTTIYLKSTYTMWTKKSITQRTQKSLRRLQDVIKRSRSLNTTKRRLAENVTFTMSSKDRIYVVLKTSNLRRFEDVWFVTSWKRLIYSVLNMLALRLPEDVRFTTFWRLLIYDVLKTSVKRHLCSNVLATSMQSRKKLFFRILYSLKYSENFKCSCSG